MGVGVRIRGAAVAGLALLLGPGLLAATPVDRAEATTATAGPVLRTGLSGQYCGTEAPRKPDGTRWRCTFGDDFNGSKLSAKWRVMTSDKFAFGNRPDCFVNSPSNLFVGYGILTLSARRLAKPITCARGTTTYQTPYTSAMVSTYGIWGQQYGRFEFRARFPYTTQRGVQTSTWLWPVGANGATWPASGEIDIAEWYSQYPHLVIPYLHYSTGFLTPSQATNTTCEVKNVGTWHRYLMVWTPKSITISYDGKVCLHNTSGSSSFDKRYFLSMFQGFGLGANAPTASTPVLSKGQFDWVRVWS